MRNLATFIFSFLFAFLSSNSAEDYLLAGLNQASNLK